MTRGKRSPTAGKGSCGRSEMPNSKVHLPNKPVQNAKHESAHNAGGHHPYQRTLYPLAHALVLVPLVVEHGEGDDEEDEHRVHDVDGEPQILHREGEVAGAVVDRVAAGLPVGDVGGEHEDRDGGHGEAEDDDDLGEVGLVGVVRVLVVDEEVDIEEEDEDAHDGRDDDEREVEIPHRSRKREGEAAPPPLTEASNRSIRRRDGGGGGGGSSRAGRFRSGDNGGFSRIGTEASREIGRAHV